MPALAALSHTSANATARISSLDHGQGDAAAAVISGVEVRDVVLSAGEPLISLFTLDVEDQLVAIAGAGHVLAHRCRSPVHEAT